MSDERTYHPAVTQTEIRLPGTDTLCLDGGGRGFLREGLLRRTGPQELLLTWTTGGITEPAIGNVTRIARSTDNGGTWQDFGMFRHPSRGLFTTELFCPRPGDGEVHALFATYPFGTHLAQLLSYRAITRDGGHTWEGPHSIPGGVQGVWAGSGIVLSGGRWVIPMCWAELTGEQWAEPSQGRPPVQAQAGLRVVPQAELPHDCDFRHRYRCGNAWAEQNHRFCAGVMIADDEGQTFRRCGYIRGGARGILLEPKVVELSDGRLVMLLRSQYEGFLLRSESVDSGETWSPPFNTGIPNPSAKVALLKARDGRIFLLHNPTGHSGAVMGGRNPLSLWVSEDDMRTWRIKADLVTDPRPQASLNYPDGFIDEEAGEILFCWEDVQRLFLMRVPLAIGT